MAITWRNIGQSSNQGNSLISGAADTINRGLGQIRGAAREVSQEQIRQYDTQADLNTANILNQIQSSDEGGLSSFNIDDLSSNFGNQFDAGAITSALGDRTDQLRAIARQASQDQLAQDSFDLDKQRTESTIALNEQQADLVKSEADNITEINSFSTQALGNLGDYDNVADAKRKVLAQAKKAGIDGMTASQIADAAAAQWESTIGVGASQYTDVFNQKAAQAVQVAEEDANEMIIKRDNRAKELGINLTLINKLEEDNKNGETLKDVLTDFNTRVAENDLPWEEDNTNRFEKEFTKILKRSPTPAEARYFLTMALQEGAMFRLSDDGLNTDKIIKDMKEYAENTGNSDKINWYRQTIRTINQAKQAHASTVANSIRALQRKEVENNKLRAKGEFIYNPINPNKVDPTKYTPIKDKSTGKSAANPLVSTDWLYEYVPPAKDAPDDSRRGKISGSR